MPWEIYAHFRIQHMVQTLGFGNLGDGVSHVDTILIEFAKLLQCTTEDFQKRRLTFKELLDLPEDVYKARTTMLLDTVCHRLEAYRSWVIQELKWNV